MVPVGVNVADAVVDTETNAGRVPRLARQEVLFEPAVVAAIAHVDAGVDAAVADLRVQPAADGGAVDR